MSVFAVIMEYSFDLDLEDFEHYTGSMAFPVGHPEASSGYEAYKKHAKTGTLYQEEYGRRRLAFALFFAGKLRKL